MHACRRSRPMAYEETPADMLHLVVIARAFYTAARSVRTGQNESVPSSQGAERVCFTHVGVILSLVVILRVLLLLATLAAAFLAAAAVGKRCAQAGHVAEAAHRVDVYVGVLAVRCVCVCV